MDYNLQPEGGVGWPNILFRFFPVLFCIICFVGLFCSHAAAQEATGAVQAGQSATPSNSNGVTSPSLAPSGQAPAVANSGASPQTGSSATPHSGGTSKDRLFFALPNFLTIENAGEVPPLTAGQKFKATARGAFDPVQVFWYGTLAGISQWNNSEPGFGQGAEGYGKRYGAAFADGVIENFMTTAILPSLFHQDPRYFQMGKGGFWHRTGYAVSRIFVTRGDSGNSQFNFSEILGSAASAGISTYSYHPRGDRNLENTASVWATQVGYDTLTYIVKEFWPDVRRRLVKWHTSQSH